MSIVMDRCGLHYGHAAIPSVTQDEIEEDADVASARPASARRAKSETRQLTELVGVRFSRDQKAALERLAAQNGMNSVAEYLRELSLTSLKAEAS